MLSGTADETPAGTPHHSEEPRPVEVPRPRGSMSGTTPRHRESKRRKKPRTRYGSQPPVQVNVYGSMPLYSDTHGHGWYQYPTLAPRREGFHCGTDYERSPPRRLPPSLKPDKISRAAHCMKCRKTQKAWEKAERQRPAAETPGSYHHAAEKAVARSATSRDVMPPTMLPRGHHRAAAAAHSVVPQDTAPPAMPPMGHHHTAGQATSAWRRSAGHVAPFNATAHDLAASPSATGARATC